MSLSGPTRIAVAVVESVGHVLVGIRPEHVSLPGKAEFPGGKCEPDEISRMAAVRECREETGLIVVPREHLVRHTHTYDHGTVELDFWRCSLSPDLPDLAAPQTPFRWVSLQELSGLDFPAGNRPALRKLLEEFTSLGHVHPRLLPSLERLDNAFDSAKRPPHFTNLTHCDACEAYDNQLQKLADGDLSLENMGNPAFDPVAHCTDEGYRFLLPSLARLAVAWPQKYFFRFLSQLVPERMQALSSGEFEGLLAFLSGLRAEAGRQNECRTGPLYDPDLQDSAEQRPYFRTDQKLVELRALERS